jgi:alcohol oxidase
MDVQTNLFLRTNSRVSRVIFEGDKAVGVAYVPARNRGHAGQIVETIVKARKCVVVSSGTLGTPQILERSGVGNAERLQKMNIKVRVRSLCGVRESHIALLGGQ